MANALLGAAHAEDFRMAGLSLLLLFQRRQSPGTRAHRITVNYGDSLLNALTPRLHTGLHFLFVSTVKILEMAVTTLVAEREIFHCRGAAFGKRLQMFKRRIFACIRNAAEAHDIAAKPAVVPVPLSHGSEFGLLGLPLEEP